MYKKKSGSSLKREVLEEVEVYSAFHHQNNCEMPERVHLNLQLSCHKFLVPWLDRHTGFQIND